MNSAIKKLEEMGQNTSLKQHDSLLEMLKGFDVNQQHIDEINDMKVELVCGLIPEDENDEDNGDGNDEGSKEK